MFLFGADVRAQEAPTATSLRASAFGAASFLHRHPPLLYV
jgi:hypothetical protein